MTSTNMPHAPDSQSHLEWFTHDILPGDRQICSIRQVEPPSANRLVLDEGGMMNAAATLRAEIARLEERMRDRADGLVHAKIGSLAMSTRFSPSRLRKCKRDHELLERLHADALAEVETLYCPQIKRLWRKFARIEQRPTALPEAAQ